MFFETRLEFVKILQDRKFDPYDFHVREVDISQFVANA